MISSLIRKKYIEETEQRKTFASKFNSTTKICNKDITISYSDMQLFNYLVNNNSPIKRSIKEELLDYLNRVRNMETHEPVWISELVKTEGSSIKRLISAQKSFNNCSFLKIACFVFNIRLIVHINSSNGLVQSEFGDKQDRLCQIFMNNEGYFIDPKFIENDRKIDLKRFNIKNQNNQKNYSILYKNDCFYKKDANINPYFANNLRSMQKENNKAAVQVSSSNDRYFANQKTLSGINGTNMNYKFISNNLNESQFEVNNSKVSKELTKHTQMRSTDISKSIESEVPLMPKTHDQPQINQDTSNKITKDLPDFNDALNFITDYQNWLRSKPLTDLETKNYKPVVIDKSNKQYEGMIRFYRENDKFGFIEIKKGKEAFVHKDNLMRSKINTKRLENCLHFFNVEVKFRLLKYKGKDAVKEKAIEIEIKNFHPKA